MVKIPATGVVRDVLLAFKCTPAEKDLIEAAAKRVGKRPSGWLRDVALQGVERIAAAVEAGRDPVEPDPNVERIAKLAKVLGGEKAKPAAKKPAKR